MALKPPPISEVMQQVSELVGPAGLVDEVDRNARQLIQSALRKLDFVSREEFDAQSEILERTRSKVAALESELAAMSALVDALEKNAVD
ncbi:accessory factor UbiK family protein [Congregibacter variabilis]|uniref:Ubiquinone biosynthesis accessory factor UbiK n=1 Tax=Congregibacter variabilis TaxID=3081200 RepID=A0ABZ0HZA9_9GAMM|nr:accessory factor UbiK family protein [Congregibacter sp. IMCC43200]